MHQTTRPNNVFATKWMVLLPVIINCILQYQIIKRRRIIKKHENTFVTANHTFPKDLESTLINITISIIMAMTTGKYSYVSNKHACNSTMLRIGPKSKEISLC